MKKVVVVTEHRTGRPRRVRHLKTEWQLMIPAMSAPQRQGVAAGVEAWRGFDTKRQTWNDWAKISMALEVGEKLCAQAAGKSEGGKYNRLYGAWLKDNGLDNILHPVRSWLRTIRQNQNEIDAWRNGLPVERRMRLNHPRSVLLGWKASQRQPTTDAEPGELERP